VAEIGRRGRLTVAEPLFGPGPTVALSGNSSAPPNAIALVEFSAGRAEIIEKLGRSDRPRDVAQALIREHRGRRSGFPRRLEKEAEAAAARAASENGDERPRRDLTGLDTFTVDPASARDFDDAVSARREGDSIRLWIHIADVAAHVKPGSALDREAYERGCSTYVPGTVEPMLPSALSAEACSLAPGVERLAVTTEVLLGPDGRPGEPAFYRSRIRSDARLDYDQLDRVFAGRERPPAPVAEPLELARAAAASLVDRGAGTALTINTVEPEFEFDSEGRVTRSVAVDETEAHRLIERLMVLTNELVAQTLERAGIPTLYRVHERPDPDRVEELFEALAELDVPTPPLPDHLQPADAAELVAAVSRSVSETIEREGRGRHAFTSQVLRSLKQAVYSPANRGHTGLGSAAYCHFTSPIRRYPDLVVHRGLLSRLGAGERPPSAGSIEAIAGQCSERERDSIRTERDADDVCAAFLLEREQVEGGYDRTYEGEVTGLIGRGAFVTFAGELGSTYEGMLPAARLGPDWYELNESRTAFVAERGGDDGSARVRLGDPVTVTVDLIEPARGRVTLARA
ncbi:MAG TPA: RNB domain-containing ribonuclease, partial [Solirubrobacterales bacterium]|nr:RNB domain-containing ribonuclease [Solirubrobacterales bacterium]